MGCRRWREIDACLDEDRDLPDYLRVHLESCPRCRRRLAAYRRFIGDLQQELEEPLALRTGPIPAPRRPPRASLLVAAGVFSLSVVAGFLLLPGLLQTRELKLEYARELSRDVLEGTLFEYADAGGLSYGESDWFN